MSEAQQNTMQFELVSPEEKLVSEPVKMAVIPGEDGVLGVGPMHASLVASLNPGVVELYKEGEAKSYRKIFIAGGFADVTGTNCTVLAEEAVDLKNLDQTDLEQKLKNLQEDLGMASEKSDQIRIEAKIRMLKAKLSAVTGTLVV
ncbi:MAG: ATP synthase F1 subunit epsilon [Alphaproteobacteria bacterium]